MNLKKANDALRLNGAETLSDQQLLGVLLGAAAEDVDPIALRKTGFAQLEATMGTAGALRVKAALELGRRALLPFDLSAALVRGPRDIADLIRSDLVHLEQEAMHVYGLDARSRVRVHFVAAVGTVDRVKVGIADVIRPLIREAVASFIVAHNHPSGDCSPSPQDEMLTLKLMQAGAMVGIPLRDHLICAREGHFSFAEEGKLGIGLPPPSEFEFNESEGGASRDPAPPSGSGPCRVLWDMMHRVGGVSVAEAHEALLQLPGEDRRPVAKTRALLKDAARRWPAQGRAAISTSTDPARGTVWTATAPVT